MLETNKIKKTAAVLIGIISIIFLVYFIQTSIGIINSIGSECPLGLFYWSTGTIITFIINLLLFSAIFFVSLTFLLLIRKNESPFNLNVVKRLKAVAILLIIYEVQNTIAQFMYPLVLFDGYLEGETQGYYTWITAYDLWGGFVIVAGLVVYCVALILQHGISLQTQVDETL
jgi:hypothetical protein